MLLNSSRLLSSEGNLKLKPSYSFSESEVSSKIPKLSMSVGRGDLFKILVTYQV